jgi:3-oxoacyl-(acyl-carrier-protein) synthase/SAM-dependent methyltransferase
MSRSTDNLEKLSPVKRALLEIREMRAKLEACENAAGEPLAVIGIGLRFPGGASDPDSFWRLLMDGVDAVGEIPADRWDIDAYYDPDPEAPGKMSTRWGGFLESVDAFDPEFFGISPREAAAMDPQQRILLEVAWESLENAGASPESVFGTRTGVFIGISSFDYLLSRPGRTDLSNIDAYFATGNSHGIASGRLSYALGLRGPSISIDTACSSSLVAIHQACRSLRSRECDLALAGGVNVILRPELHINFTKNRAAASDGRCKAFDAAADGFVRSEGCGIVVLKRLSDALRDADTVLALIRGSAVNQDGRSSGLTAPNGPSQQEVVRGALADGGISPGRVDYVEAHGTGTSLGDPIEVEALSAVFGNRPMSDPLKIGSVKTNLGHLEAAAGVAGVIKTVLALWNERIPPHLHLKQPNPLIPWDKIPVAVPTRGVSWPRGGGKRIAGVSAFGFSGTNAHVVLEEGPIPEMKGEADRRPFQILTLSARSDAALRQQAKRIAAALSARPESPLADVAHTLNAGRSHFSHRLAMIVDSAGQAREKLLAVSEGETPAGLFFGDIAGPEPPEIVFVFTGPGYYPACVGRRLYEIQPTFRNAVDRCAELSRHFHERPLLSVFHLDESDGSLLNEPVYARLALFAFEHALAELWRSWGVEPSAAIGEGEGALAAACETGALSLEDGLKRIARGGDDPSGSEETADLRGLFEKGDRLFLEIGPAPARGFATGPLPAAPGLPSFRSGGCAWCRILENLGTLYVRGAKIDWRRFDGPYALRKIALPAYPFQRERYRVTGPKPERKEDTRNRPRAWEEAVSAGRRQSSFAPIDLALHTYDAKWGALERLTTSYIVQALRRLSIFAVSGESHSVDTILSRFRVSGTYRHLLYRWLIRLAGKRLLTQRGDLFFAGRPLPDPKIGLRLAAAREALKDTPFLAEYIERCGEKLVSVLTGKESPLETLFPGGDSGTAEKIYREWALSRYFNGIAAAAAASRAKCLPHDRIARILEIGAGTGGTTSAVLPMLDPDRTDYFFTDISEIFFHRAKSSFGSYPFVRYGALDIEKAPPADRGSYDIVIAANVLHATRNLSKTVGNVVSLLAPGGLLILYEATDPHPWFDTSVALIEGWRRFEDEFRKDGPLIGTGEWESLLRSEGFVEFAAFPEKGSPAEILKAHVMLAQTPFRKASEKVEIVIPPRMTGRRDIESGAAVSLPRSFEKATSAEREALFLEYVRKHVNQVLGRDGSKPLARNQRLMELGIDSLMAVELRNRLGKGLAPLRTLPATLVYDYPTVGAVAEFLAKETGASGEGTVPNEGATKDAPDRIGIETIATLSEAAVEELILKKIELCG